MRYSELYRFLEAHGCRILKEGANHSLWFSPITGKKFPVGRHSGEEVKTGTLRSILKDAGMIDLLR